MRVHGLGHVVLKVRDLKQSVPFYRDVLGLKKVKKDNIIFTTNNEIHATFFPVETRLIVSSRLPRDQETYENDTVRVNFINEINLKQMLKDYGSTI